MIHQHFKLVDILTAAENIVLGLPGRALLNRKALAAEIAEISAKYGLDVDPNKKIYEMSVSEKADGGDIKSALSGREHSHPGRAHRSAGRPRKSNGFLTFCGA